MKSIDIKRKATKKLKPAKRKFVRAVPRPKIHWSKTLIGTAGLAVLLLAVFAFLVLPEVRVTAQVRTEPVTRDFEIRVDRRMEQPNLAELAAPGKIVEQEITGTKAYSATGTRNIGKLASGFVHIYNFSKNTLILKAQTTVLTAGNRKYYFTQDVGNIRPTAFIGLEQQEVDPSSLIAPVPVVAAEPGEAFNMKQGERLEIENEVFGKQPKLLYTVASDDITGGLSQEIKVITAGDISAAYAALSGELVENARKALVNLNSNVRLQDSALKSQVVEEKSSATPGTEKGEFDATVRLKLAALVYDEAQIEKIITERIARLLPENKVLEQTGAARLQSKFASVDLEQGTGVLQNHYEAQIVYRVDEGELVQRIKGKSEAEIRDILLSRPEISEVDVKFYPFWVKNAPKFTKKIFLRVTKGEG